MKAKIALVIHGCVGAVLTLFSTFVGKRSAVAVYSDIMGCENGCDVVATGWPMIFVSDYLGMSMVNTADITEVWFAADRFDWLMFLVNAAFWTFLSITLNVGLNRWSAPWGSSD